MLAEAKKALRVTVDEFDSDIMYKLMAGARDLEIAGVVLPGEVSCTESDGVITDTSTLTDPLAMQAILTYAAMRFGDPPNYDQLAAAYETQKVQLMHAGDYTDYGEDADG